MIRICLFGAGRAGLVHAVNIQKRMENAELEAICDADQSALDSAANRLGVEKRFTDFRKAMGLATGKRIDLLKMVSHILDVNEAAAAFELAKQPSEMKILLRRVS